MLIKVTNTFLFFFLFHIIKGFRLSDISLYQYNCNEIEIKKEDKTNFAMLNIKCETTPTKTHPKFIFAEKIKIEREVDEYYEPRNEVVSKILSYYNNKNEKNLCIECIIENNIYESDYLISNSEGEIVFLDKKNDTISEKDIEMLYRISDDVKANKNNKSKKWRPVYFSHEEYLFIIKRLLFISLLLILL